MPHVNVIFFFCRIVIRNLVMNMQESFHQGSVLGLYVVEDKDFVLNSYSRICCMQSIYAKYLQVVSFTVFQVFD